MRNDKSDCATRRGQAGAGWISVEDRLPAIGKTVIVAGGIAYRMPDEWISQTGAASGRPIMWPVTHWMPLPDPPAVQQSREGGE
jgi:hypothetical protein